MIAAAAAVATPIIAGDSFIFIGLFVQNASAISYSKRKLNTRLRNYISPCLVFKLGREWFWAWWRGGWGWKRNGRGGQVLLLTVGFLADVVRNNPNWKYPIRVLWFLILYVPWAVPWNVLVFRLFEFATHVRAAWFSDFSFYAVFSYTIRALEIFLAFFVFPRYDKIRYLFLPKLPAFRTKAGPAILY